MTHPPLGPAVVAASLLLAACDEVVTVREDGPPWRFDITADAQGFAPDSLQIHLGDTLRFEFASPAHSVSWEPQYLGTVPLPWPASTNMVRLLVIERAGTFRYRCDLHEGEEGVVHVLPTVR